ncbi:hypothetical protein [Pontibacter liquoris]|uniref:hypothetical protein n=1 Tax=Pontibacter liquoris TaxID=2905677 RepID=UPI001FA6CDF2|nr:hypothetical protein [Pontibacter liquoris]
MDLIIFSCRARFASFFRHKKLQNLLLLVLGIVVSGIYSWMFSFMLRKAHEGGINPSVDEVLRYTNLFLMVIIVMRGFFPSYTPRTEFISRLYPVPPLQRFWVELVVEFTSPFYLILLNFMVILFLLSPDYGFIDLLQSVLVLLTAHVTRRSLQILVERKIRWKHSTFRAAAVMAAAFIALQAKAPMFKAGDTPFLLVVHAAAFGFFLASNFLLEQAAAEPKRREVRYSQNAKRSLSWRLFKNHKLARQMIIFGLAFKVLILVLDAVSFALKGKHLYDQNISIWLFMGPAILYTYVFNNAWGFYRNLWLTMERANGTYKDFIIGSLLPLRVPLLADAAVTALYVALFNHQMALFIVLFYLGSVLVLTPLGIIASFTSPKVVVNSVFSFSSKTSYLYSFISLVLIGMLYLPLLHPLLYLLYPLLIGGVLLALMAVLKEYPRYKYKLFETLFKAKA